MTTALSDKLFCFWINCHLLSDKLSFIVWYFGSFSINIHFQITSHVFLVNCLTRDYRA